MRKDSVYLIQELVEYVQRKELGLIEKTKVTLTFKDRHVDLFLTKPAFLVEGDKIKKITNKVEESNSNEFNETIASNKGHRIKMDAEMIKLLEKELGKFDINLFFMFFHTI